jgi:hypothetical protein
MLAISGKLVYNILQNCELYFTIIIFSCQRTRNSVSKQYGIMQMSEAVPGSPGSGRPGLESRTAARITEDLQDRETGRYGKCKQGGEE